MIVAPPTIGAVVAIILILLFSNQIAGAINGLRVLVVAAFMAGLFALMAYVLLLLGAFLPIIFGSIGLLFGVGAFLGLFSTKGWQANGPLKNMGVLGLLGVFSAACLYGAYLSWQQECIVWCLSLYLSGPR